MGALTKIIGVRVSEETYAKLKFAGKPVDIVRRLIKNWEKEFDRPGLDGFLGTDSVTEHRPRRYER